MKITAKSSRRFVRILLPALIIGALGLTAVPRTASADDLICESRSGERHTCRASAGAGVILLTQLSGAGCYEGSTWGYDSREIWVANGCRAVFRTDSVDYSQVREHDSADPETHGAGAIAAIALALGAAAAIHNARENDDDDDYHDYSRYRSRTTTVTCESTGGYRECSADVGRNGDVHITHQMSRSSCRFDDDWGFDRRSIWVDNGCRARFEVEK